MCVRPWDGGEDRRIAHVEILEPVDQELVAHDVAARTDRMEIDADRLVDRRAHGAAEPLHRRVPGELLRELERLRECLAIAVIGQQAVVDLPEVDATARVWPEEGDRDVRSRAVTILYREQVQIRGLDDPVGKGE